MSAINNPTIDRIARAHAHELMDRIDHELGNIPMEQRDELLRIMDVSEHAYQFLLVSLLALVRKSQRIDTLDDNSIGLVFLLVGQALCARVD